MFYRPMFGMGALVAAAMADATLPLIDIVPRQPGNRPRDFWQRKRYPLEELRRLAAERGSGSVRRINNDLRATFERTAQ